MAADGLVITASNYGPEETVARLEAEIKAHGLNLFAHIDHAAGAKSAGMGLRPTDLLIFGSPKSGTPLMQAEQTVGIDLPMKALVWQDAQGKTFVGYNDPVWLVQRHGATETKPVAEKIAGALAEIVNKAAGAK